MKWTALLYSRSLKLTLGGVTIRREKMLEWIKRILTFWMNKDEMTDPFMDNVLRFVIMSVFAFGFYLTLIAFGDKFL